MNERIRKLAKQAYNLAGAESTSGQHECTVGSDYFLALKDQKFAELIVKECAEICDQQGCVGWNGDRKAQARLDRDLIKEHFGVE